MSGLGALSRTRAHARLKMPAAFSKKCISSSEQTPYSGQPGQEYPQKDNNQGDLQPNKAADFPEDKLDPRTPWRRNSITNGLHASLYGALKSREQFRFLVKCSGDAQPGQYHGKNSKRVNLGVMPQP